MMKLADKSPKLIRVLSIITIVILSYALRACDDQAFRFSKEEITFYNELGNATLAGTLTLPKNIDNYPFVILISGSGQQDRDETIYGHKPFKVLAEFLSSNGIGVLRYDDRGIGGSTGNVWDATLEVQASDAHAGIQYLKSRCDFDPCSIGVIGHSLGAMQGALLASEYSDISFLIMLGGIGIPWKENHIKSDMISNRLNGEHEEVIEAGAQLLESLLQVLENTSDNQDFKSLRDTLTQVLYNWQANLTGQARNEIESFTDENPTWMKNMAEEYATPIYISCARFNPALCLSNIDCPVLSIIGDKDTQAIPENQDAIRMALEKGGNENIKLITPPGINHMLQQCETGSINEYPELEEDFNLEIMSEILNWIKGLP